jgi:hypothetical protein
MTQQIDLNDGDSDPKHSEGGGERIRLVSVTPVAPLGEANRRVTLDDTYPSDSNSVEPEFSSSPDSERGAVAMLANQLHELGYHPVILFGSSNSGKTSILLSLLAAARTRVEFQTSIRLCDNIISGTSAYGQFLQNESRKFFESKVTNFILGTSAVQTKVNLPFFIPIEFTASNGDTVNIAFMEANGEWFQPRRDNEGSIFAAKNNASIETFMREFSGGMSFIYLLPFTQREIGSADGYSTAEDQAVTDAGLAIQGVIDQYTGIRDGIASQDRHLLLVTKWDARSNSRDPASETLASVLAEPVEEVKSYLENHDKYRPAVVSFRGIRNFKTKNVRNYCAGRMRGREVDWPGKEHDYFDSISQFPVSLWTWIYRGAYNSEDASPFPPPKKLHPGFVFIKKLISTLVG